MFLTGITITFLREFGIGLWLTCPLWLSLALGIMVLGQITGKKEGCTAFESIYWSFVTAAPVGYGDARGHFRARRPSRCRQGSMTRWLRRLLFTARVTSAL